MVDRIEFFNCPDGSISAKPSDGDMVVFDMTCRHIVEEMVARIKELYPGAYAVLAEIYSRSERNRDYFEYRIVHRFIRCNFGEYDALSFDVTPNGFNFEEVKCPLRGECLYEGIICKPKLQNRLSAREREVADLLSRGRSKYDVAEELCISICTVSRHIANIKARLNLNHTHQIIAYCNGKDY